jgi:predicted nucleic acid-binding protein
MKYVLDSNVAVKWLIDEDLSDKARVLRDEFIRGLHELLAPDVFLVEAAHALTRAQRQGRVTDREVGLFFDDLLTSLPQFHAYRPLLARAIETSVRARHNVYDCLYVALAEREGCEVLTADDKMQSKLPGSPVVLLASLP